MPATSLILVPQGAEFKAVRRGIGQGADSFLMLPIPACPDPVRQRLKDLYQAGKFVDQQTVLVMGLCGALQPQLSLGDVVLYQNCSFLSPLSSPPSLPCDRPFTHTLQEKLGERATLVNAVTSDRVISTVAEKRSLASHGEVVDMEGYAILEFFSRLGIPVATLRVVSDDCHHNLPNLASAYGADGSLRPLSLGLGLVRQPIAASRLIRGSLRGLKVLQQIAETLLDKRAEP
jgi:hypothetical protein